MSKVNPITPIQRTNNNLSHTDKRDSSTSTSTNKGLGKEEGSFSSILKHEIKRGGSK